MQPAAAPVFFAAAIFLSIVLIRSACFNFGGASGSQCGKDGELPVTDDINSSVTRHASAAAFLRLHWPAAVQSTLGGRGIFREKVQCVARTHLTPRELGRE